MKLADLRKAAGLTQKQLADASGVPSQNISRLERGERSVSSISLASAVRLAKVLGVHAEDLLD